MRLPSQINRRSKTCFFIFLNVYLSWIERDKILISQLSPPTFTYFADHNEPKGEPMKMNFDNFQMQKWVSLTVTAQEADEKNGVICLVFMSSSCFMVLKFSKMLSFLQFFADVSKKSEAVIAIYVYASESSFFTLLEIFLSTKIDSCGFFSHLNRFKIMFSLSFSLISDFCHLL